MLGNVRFKLRKRKLLKSQTMRDVGHGVTIKRGHPIGVEEVDANLRTSIRSEGSALHQDLHRQQTELHVHVAPQLLHQRIGDDGECGSTALQQHFEGLHAPAVTYILKVGRQTPAAGLIVASVPRGRVCPCGFCFVESVACTRWSEEIVRCTHWISG